MISGDELFEGFEDQGWNEDSKLLLVGRFLEHEAKTNPHNADIMGRLTAFLQNQADEENAAAGIIFKSVAIPAAWATLLRIDDLEGTGVARRPTGQEMRVDDSTPYRDDERTITVNLPDLPDGTKVFIDVRLCSGDTNYHGEAVLFHGGNDRLYTYFEEGDKRVELWGEGKSYFITLEWPIADDGETIILKPVQSKDDQT